MITPLFVRSLSCSIKKLVISSRPLKVLQSRKSYCCITPSSNVSFRWFVSSTSNRFPMASEKPKVVFVLGGPGAGKGTQCQKIVDKFGFVHLSAGDLLREERARPGSQYGDEIETHIRNGTIVPVKVTCSLLENAMNKNMKELGKDKFLVDGFPRNQDNLDGWNEQMSDKAEVCFVLFFNCPEEVCTQRCLSRGQSGSGRSDDNAESLKKRIVTYNNDSLPIIEHFKKIDLVREIDAGMSPDDVFACVEKAINECTAIGAGSQ